MWAADLYEIYFVEKIIGRWCDDVQNGDDVFMSTTSVSLTCICLG